MKKPFKVCETKEELEKMRRRLTRAYHWTCYSVLKKRGKIPQSSDANYSDAMTELKNALSRVSEHAITLGWLLSPEELRARKFDLPAIYKYTEPSGKKAVSDTEK